MGYGKGGFSDMAEDGCLRRKENGMEVHIRSVGTMLPGPPVDTPTLAKRFGLPAVWEQWVETFIGTRTRHYAVDLDSGKVRHSLADLGTAAGERALAAAGMSAADVDLIVMGTSAPDLLLPATVNIVADRLGIDGIPTYQLQSGCAGAVQALDVAQQMLHSGQYRTALVLGADSCAKHFDFTIDVAALSSAEQINGVLFGDGAGAVVLSVEGSADSVVLRQIRVRLAGRNRPPGLTLDWFGAADRYADRLPAMEDYQAIRDLVPSLAVEMLDEMLDGLSWDRSDLDYVLPPQLSARMTAHIQSRLDVPDAQEVSCIDETGNMGNALAFFQLERLLPRMITGDRALGIAIESSKWIKTGFALEKV
jgi:3-oxoacyl-[acyl-carrier-protein] synthase-3